MELIKIYNGNLVDARELHQFLVVEAKGGQKGERFVKWLNRMLEYGYELNKDYFSQGYNYKGNVIEINGVSQKGESDNQRVSKRDFYLTINCAKEISMLQRNDKGKEARAYFIKCEETLHVLKQSKRFEAFLKLETTKERLLENVISIGGGHDNYLQIDLAGRQVFFNGTPIPDEELNTLAIKGRDLATEMTNDALREGEHTIDSVEKLNKEQHKTVREAIIKGTGKKPENLPTGEKIKKLGEA